MSKLNFSSFARYPHGGVCPETTKTPRPTVQTGQDKEGNLCKPPVPGPSVSPGGAWWQHGAMAWQPQLGKLHVVTVAQSPGVGFFSEGRGWEVFLSHVFSHSFGSSQIVTKSTKESACERLFDMTASDADLLPRLAPWWIGFNMR